MLRLPQSNIAPRRFSRAVPAEITRGAKTKAGKPEREPVISLVKQADAALQAYYGAWNEHFKLREAMPKADRDWPRMAPPADLIHEFGYNFLFTSTAHVRKQFRFKIRQARDRISQHKASLRKWLKPDQLEAQLAREVTPYLAADQELLQLLLRRRDKCVADFERHERRLLCAQRKAGLLDARKKRRQAWLKLGSLTKQVAKAKPKTAAGALAIVGYVEARQWDDLFNDDSGDFPGNFGPLLRCAHKVLVEHYRKAPDVFSPH